MHSNHPEKEVRDFIEKYIQSKTNYSWLYNVQEARRYTYEELWQQRNRPLYKNQTLSLFKEKEQHEFLEKFRVEALDNPEFYKIDYKNIKDYIEAPWPDEVNDNAIGETQEDDLQSSEDIDSIPEELRIR